MIKGVPTLHAPHKFFKKVVYLTKIFVLTFPARRPALATTTRSLAGATKPYGTGRRALNPTNKMFYALVLFVIFLVLLYFTVELGWGGGDPHDPHHNRPPWSLW